MTTCSFEIPFDINFKFWGSETFDHSEEQFGLIRYCEIRRSLIVSIFHYFLSVLIFVFLSKYGKQLKVIAAGLFSSYDWHVTMCTYLVSLTSNSTVFLARLHAGDFVSG